MSSESPQSTTKQPGPAARLLQRVASLYGRGDLGGAEDACRQLLQLDPAQTDALHVLGLVAWRRGERERALEQIRKAIASDPRKPQPHNSLGVMLKDLGDLQAAEAAFRAAIDLLPDYPDALTNLGNILCETGRLADAEIVHRRVVELAPQYADGHNNLATTLSKQERWDEAAAACRAAIGIQPTRADFHFNLGSALSARENWEEAAAAYRRAADLAPENADAHANLGLALQHLRKFEPAVEALRVSVRLRPSSARMWSDLGAALVEIDHPDEVIKACRRALEIDPGFVEAYVNMGKALHMNGRYSEAIACFEAALAVRPNYVKAYNNMGVALSGLSRFAEAQSAYAKAIELDGDFIEARWNEGLLRLLLGDLKSGWKSYDYGLEMSRGRSRFRLDKHPIWMGSSLAGKRLLVWSEQGVGDQIMFASLLLDLLEQGADCVIEADRRLEPLFRRSFPKSQFLERKSVDAEDVDRLNIDYQAFMGSLCRWLRPDLESFPSRRSFLRTDTARVALLRDRYRRRFGDRLIVGISWMGGTGAVRRVRSIPLMEWSAILSQPGVGWVSLQYGDHADELAAVRNAFGVDVFLDQAVDPLQDLDAFAAQTAAMDLVISIDNSTVHMAGALDVPVWIMLPKVPDWRWLLERSHSHWYPSARLFRQTMPADWTPAITAVANALAERLDGGSSDQLSEGGQRPMRSAPSTTDPQGES